MLLLLFKLPQLHACSLNPPGVRGGLPGVLAAVPGWLPAGAQRRKGGVGVGVGTQDGDTQMHTSGEHAGSVHRKPEHMLLGMLAQTLTILCSKVLHRAENCETRKFGWCEDADSCRQGRQGQRHMLKARWSDRTAAAPA